MRTFAKLRRANRKARIIAGRRPKNCVDAINAALNGTGVSLHPTKGFRVSGRAAATARAAVRRGHARALVNDAPTLKRAVDSLRGAVTGAAASIARVFRRAAVRGA